MTDNHADQLYLPPSNRLPVDRLAACFNKVTTSYKFYWFMSILDHIQREQTPVIPIRDLLVRMVASVWYPTNYFRLSFGKQDRLGQIALALKEQSGLEIDAKKQTVIEEALILLTGDSALAAEIMSLNRFVPYRFVRPFFGEQLRGKLDHKIKGLIVDLTEEAFTNEAHLPLYRFIATPQDSIEIQPHWFEYLQQHHRILSGFCLWHLLNYLQKNNPNVPNIAAKLFEPEQRDLKQARQFWQRVFKESGSIRCIYSDQEMRQDNFSLDHFLPWRFVTHDMLWNIIPTPRSVNSAKSDNLPSVERYFTPFARLQYQAVRQVEVSDRSTLFEDYILLFKMDRIAEVKALSFDQFQETLHNTIVPQIQIARNMGFAADWSYAA